MQCHIFFSSSNYFTSANYVKLNFFFFVVFSFLHVELWSPFFIFIGQHSLLQDQKLRASGKLLTNSRVVLSLCRLLLYPCEGLTLLFYMYLHQTGCKRRNKKYMNFLPIWIWIIMYYIKISILKFRIQVPIWCLPVPVFDMDSAFSIKSVLEFSNLQKQFAYLLTALV